MAYSGPMQQAIQLRFILPRRLAVGCFGVPVPNLTPWRASVTGDMTSAFNFAAPPDPSPPNLDHPVRQLPKVAKCVPNVVLGFLNEGLPYRVPYPQTTPVQESGPARPIPSGIC